MKYVLKKIKWFFQKVFRPSHVSDIECWGLTHTLAKSILPKLQEFKKLNVNSHPTEFSEYDENYFGDKEKWEEMTKDAREFGYGMEGWHKVIDEMIFAFEYEMANHNDKAEKRFAQRYGDRYAVIDKNKKKHFLYRSLDNGNIYMFSEDQPTPPPGFEEAENDAFVEMMSKEYYYDSEMDMEMAERAQHGYELFGKYFRSLWD